FKWSDNPMMRSGLVLAGGNHAWQHGRPLYPGLEDGILTAQDITQMNLRNTELVVLSACETGLGDIQGNEGVYGLQRAFKIAGAQYLIMSLWRVPDEETAEFMEKFYRYWLEGKLPIRNAFREAQREMRRKYENKPHKWAGFVLVE
ncbi:CHAT domain-containing protein, partial [Arthrospira platensis SPKY1]|nr:CHAT domain-containing protein [Arthrospira platensis SPKY1]